MLQLCILLFLSILITFVAIIIIDCGDHQFLLYLPLGLTFQYQLPASKRLVFRTVYTARFHMKTYGDRLQIKPLDTP